MISLSCQASSNSSINPNPKLDLVQSQKEKMKLINRQNTLTKRSKVIIQKLTKSKHMTIREQYELSKELHHSSKDLVNLQELIDNFDKYAWLYMEHSSPADELDL